MGTPAQRQFVYQPAAAGPRDFILFWASRYDPGEDADYAKHVNSPHTPESLRLLFRWKLGTQFQNNARLEERDRDFISRMDAAAGLGPDVTAERFLEQFPDGGRIARIFWLHCWHPDQSKRKTG